MLIDDENIALKSLTSLLETIDEVQILGSFSNPFEGFFHLDLLNPDIIFLDIDMPEINGIHLAEQISKKHKNIHIVFITAFDEYAIKTFELNAVDYLLKPTSVQRLQKCIHKIINKKDTSNTDSINALSHTYKENIKKVFVYEDDNIILLDLEDIIYLEAINKNSKIRTQEKFYHTKYPLNYFEQKLPDNYFCRIHRSFLVNLLKIESFKRKINYNYDVSLKNIPDIIPASKAKINKIKEILQY